MRSWVSGAAAGLALAAGMSVREGAAGADPLGAYRWKARVLVLSAPAADATALRRQRADIAAAGAQMRERDLVVVEAIGDGTTAAALRHRLGLPADGFRAVLVGKDGEAKITAREPIPTDQLFGTIDAMPMRRNEMRR